MTDLDAIRARDAGCSLADEFDGIGTDSAIVRAYDRRALLAEVDRLRESLSTTMTEDYFAGHAQGESDERARIRERVEGLPATATLHTCWDDHSGLSAVTPHADGSACVDQPADLLSRAAVLRVIEGDEE